MITVDLYGIKVQLKEKAEKTQIPYKVQNNTI